MRRSMLWLPWVLLFVTALLTLGLSGCAGTEAVAEPQLDRPRTDISQMTEEQKEQFVREKLEGHLEGSLDVAYSGEMEGFRGMLEDFFINDGNGEMLGKVTVEALTGEMVSIIFFNDVTASGVPGLTMEELKGVALDYLADWGYVLDDGYDLESEEFFPAVNYGPGPEEKTYEYRVGWRRVTGGFEVADDECALTIDPYGSKVISCYFPSMKKDEAEDIAGEAEVISEEEAIEAAKRECPSPEEWLESLRSGAGLEVEVTEKAHKYIKTVDPQRPVIWQVEIMYEAYRPETDHDGGNAIDHQGYFVEIDAGNGEIVLKDMCR